jgi:anti-sigma factor RsiW
VTVRVEQLAALADGTLPERRRPALEAALARSPEMARALDEQRRVVRVMRSLDIDPPVALRERVS